MKKRNAALALVLWGCAAGDDTTSPAGDGPPPPPACNDCGPAAPPSARDAGGSDATPPPTPLTDDAQIVAAKLPSALACLASDTATVTVKNTGTTTWTRALGYKLGAVGDKDAFADTRVWLADTDSVAPGATHDFTMPMQGPLTTGVTIGTKWQMVREGVSWFGGAASQSVAVTCAGEPAFAGAQIFNSPPDTASWPVTTKITELDIRADGVAVTFDKKDGPTRWPDVTPPGWDGPLQYTLWIMLNVGGKWAASGIIQFWYGLAASGGDITKDNQVAKNWVYDGRWGTLAGHQPAVGEAVGFMVTAGNVRGVPDASQSVRERSDMVVVAFPTAAPATFTF